jgi:hypothetical protein
MTAIHVREIRSVKQTYHFLFISIYIQMASSKEGKLGSEDMRTSNA